MDYTNYCRVSREYFEALCFYLKGEKVCDESRYWQEFKFEAYIPEKTTIIFVWFKNVSFLKIGETEIRFTHAKISGTWPNHSKKNLCVGYGNDYGAIICLKPYRKIEEKAK